MPSFHHPSPGLTQTLLKQLPLASSISAFLSLRCSLGKSRCQVFVKVVQSVWRTTRHRTLLCRPQGPAFIIRLCSLFGYNVWNRNVSSTSALLSHKPSANLLIKTSMYFNRARISAGCLFEIHLSVLDPCLTHCWEGQSLGKVTGRFQPTYFTVFLVFLKSYSYNTLEYKDNLWSSTSILQWILDLECITAS